MNFLPDVYVLCEVCGGKRYNQETLAVKYNGHSIADLLEMPISDALPILENIPQVNRSCRLWWMSALATCIWDNPRSRFLAARRSALSWRVS